MRDGFAPACQGLRVARDSRNSCERHGGLPAAVLADRERLVGLLVAVDDHERDLLELGVADPLADGLVGVVDLDPVRGELRGQRARGLAVASPTGSTRTCTGASQNGNAPAKCSIRMPMKRSNEPISARWINDGSVLGVVGALVAEPEALRHLEVELDRPDLPRAAERVEHVQVDLRPVERAVALVDRVLEPAPLERRRAAPPRRSPTPRRCRACSRAGSRARTSPRSRRGRRGSRSRGSRRSRPRSARACRRCARRPGRCATRSSPCSAPPSSSRCSVDDSANRSGSSR